MERGASLQVVPLLLLVWPSVHGSVRMTQKGNPFTPIPLPPPSSLLPPPSSLLPPPSSLLPPPSSLLPPPSPVSIGVALRVWSCVNDPLDTSPFFCSPSSSLSPFLHTSPVHTCAAFHEWFRYYLQVSFLSSPLLHCPISLILHSASRNNAILFLFLLSLSVFCTSIFIFLYIYLEYLLNVSLSVDHLWKHLVYSLGGVFCGSLQYLDNRTTTQPVYSFAPDEHNPSYKSSPFGGMSNPFLCLFRFILLFFFFF